MPVEYALRARSLTKYYGSQRGIEDVDLDVHGGEVFGFLGPNGAGKTTTIRTIVGLLHPTRGHVDVLGLDVRRHGVETRRQMGYLPGELALYTHLTGEELCAFVARMRGGVPAPAYHALAERLQLDLSRHIRDLSKGNRQKLGIVQAFMHDPELLVLDEPTGGLDPVVQQEFHALVRETVARGATVFLSSHILAEVELMAERVGIIADGRLLVVETVEGLKARALRRIELWFPSAPPVSALRNASGVTDVTATDSFATCTVTGPVTDLLGIAVAHGVVDVRTEEPDLEEIFLGLLRDGGGES
ncbi:MAG TPA: ABC transporter ATP-binding protein [Actinomycetes bacterium]|nr:ABC transporter ATP-binding protein [Actinomycetes bacterium]